MTLDKVSKFDGWKHRFYLLSAPSKRENYEFRQYNKKPDLMSRKCALPRIPDEDFDKIIEEERSFKNVADGEDTQAVLYNHPQGACGKTCGRSKGQDQSPYWPDFQRHAKAMLEAVSRKDKNAIPGMETFNLERILSLLAEASRIQQLEADLKTANQRASDGKTTQKKAEEAQKKADESLKKANEALKKAEADHGTLKGVSEENTNLKTKVEKLEKEAAQAQINFTATLEAEQNRLVAESDADNDARMKIAWAALYPNKDYGIWALAHWYAEDVVYLREKGEPKPESFDAWANANTELPAPKLPGPGEAQEIPLEDERSFKNVADGEDTQAVLYNHPQGACGKTCGRSKGQDQSPYWPDFQRHAKAMLEAVSRKDKNAIPGMETFNLERILSLLAEASRIQQLEADLKTANQRASDGKTAQKKAEEAQKKADESLKKADEALKKAEADHGTLKGVSEENTNLKTKVEKLEKEAAQAQINFTATLEAEQNRLVAESDADNDARMKIAWAALYPNKDYGIWALAHWYAEDVVYLREKGEPEPESFDVWANANTELPTPKLPGPGEAQEIPLEDE
ncbi:uncharacterized protein LOC110720072 [Chenopodium quinoa]|uniref:uncharacterized protein LOC110720072 n=1 Tax=Chenopodium quinoa TaxID=63459 RepID=UPI000B781F6E|nr:uncharacterized protein LOC110720072 [Chenopodium quinoa]